MTEFSILLTTAVSIGFFHTLVGVDHYVPFIVLGRANDWTVKKTMLIVLVCGIGHVAVTVALGFGGIALSAGVSSLVDIEGIRAEIATYFLIAFGFVYTVFGISRAIKSKAHKHIAPDGHTIIHAHSKEGAEHEHRGKKHSTNVFWGLFILLVLGPCEPLIPIIMYPAATASAVTLVTVTLCFAVVTILTMLAATFIGLKGVRLVKIEKLERYSHALAGVAVLTCGLAVLLLPI